MRVVDGDTLAIGEQHYRLHGIDAAEAGQTCKRADGGNWRCGTAATDRLNELVLRGNLACQGTELDDYGRMIAICTAGDIELNRTMVAEGLAWAFVQFSEDYAAIETQSRALGLGIWQAPTQTPWDYRAQRWDVALQESPEGCPIKGNISTNGHIYHAPWSPWYSRTKVSLEKGERWFCTEREALDAGWRAPIWGATYR